MIQCANKRLDRYAGSATLHRRDSGAAFAANEGI
jgi:hypothetical protein